MSKKSGPETLEMYWAVKSQPLAHPLTPTNIFTFPWDVDCLTTARMCPPSLWSKWPGLEEKGPKPGTRMENPMEPENSALRSNVSFLGAFVLHSLEEDTKRYYPAKAKGPLGSPSIPSHQYKRHWHPIVIL